MNGICATCKNCNNCCIQRDMEEVLDMKEATNGMFRISVSCLLYKETNKVHAPGPITRESISIAKKEGTKYSITNTPSTQAGSGFGRN